MRFLIACLPPGLRLAILFLYCTAAPVWASTATLDAHSSGTYLNMQVDKFVDRSDVMSLWQVIAADSFAPTQGATSWGNVGHPVWFRLTLERSAGTPTRWWLETHVDEANQVSYFYPDENGGFRASTAGEDYPFSSKMIPYRGYAYPVDFPPLSTSNQVQSVTVYFRLQNNGPIVFPLQVWQTEQWAEHGMLEYLLIGVCVGVMAGLACYNLLLYVRLRDKLFLMYFFSVCMYLLLIADITGLGMQVLWPENGYRIPYRNQVIIFGNGVSLILFALFLLRSDGGLNRWLAISMKLAVAIYLATVAAAFVGYGNVTADMVLITPVLMVPLLLVAAIWRAIQGFRPALYFLIGNGPTLVGLALLEQAAVGRVQANALSQTLYVIAGGWEAIFFSQALAERFSMLRKEKDSALQLILEEKTRRLDDANRHAAELQDKVRERTCELEESNIKLVAVSREKSAFFARISHDLRTPLSSIIGYADVLTHDARLVRRGKELSVIRHSAQHLLVLIDELIEFASGQIDGSRLAPKAVYLNALLDEVMSQAEMIAKESGNRIGLQCHDALPHVVQLDPVRVRQVLLNLLSNAIKFTRQGEVTLRVTAQAVSHDMRHGLQSQSLRFEVADTGDGIEPDDVARIFEPFYRTAAAQRGTPGMGLGLAICRQWVRAMGGELDVQSAVGQGSRFSFQIEVEAAAENEVPIESWADSLNLDGAGRCILVAEDADNIRHYLVDLLCSYGFKVIVVANGREALHHAGLHALAVVITDQCMPELDGWGLLRALRAQHGTALPVILLSATPACAPEGWPAYLQFDESLLKPVDSRRLLSLLARLLNLPVAASEAALAQGDTARTDEDAMVIGDMVLPDREQLDALRRLAEQGALSRLEALIAELVARSPEYAAFARVVLAFAENMDMEGLARYCESVDSASAAKS